MIPLKGPQGTMPASSKGKTPQSMGISACAVDGKKHGPWEVVVLAPPQPWNPHGVITGWQGNPKSEHHESPAQAQQTLTGMAPLNMSSQSKIMTRKEDNSVADPTKTEMKCRRISGSKMLG